MKWNTKEDLRLAAESKGYRPEILEKVDRLLDFLQVMMSVPFLKERLALKGGTAINLFCTDQLPRLSVDLDFNYIGAIDRESMLKEKSEIDEIIFGLCHREQYQLDRNPRAHAGGKMVLMYDSVLGRKSRLEIDLNYLYRTPLWMPQWQYSADWPNRIGVSVLDIHELAAGKLQALLSRVAARDLFDSHQLLTKWPLDNAKLRLAFTVYSGMRKNSWREMSDDKVRFDIKDIRNKLIPVLKRSLIPGTKFQDIKQWADTLVSETQLAFQKVLPFTENERDFLSILERGEIKPELLSSGKAFCEAVRQHPALLWRIKNSDGILSIEK